MMMKMMLVGMLMLAGTTTMNAEDNNVTSEIDTTYIKLDENREPINHVNLTYEELVEKVGELRPSWRLTSSSFMPAATILIRWRTAM